MEVTTCQILKLLKNIDRLAQQTRIRFQLDTKMQLDDSDKTHFNDYLTLLFCQSGFEVQLLCSSKQCKNASAFVCRNKQCGSCEQNHKNCKLIHIEKIIGKINQKKQESSVKGQRRKQLISAIQYLQKIYQNLIETISTELENLRIWKQHLQFNELQFYFIQALRRDSHPIKQVNGEFCHNLIKSAQHTKLRKDQKRVESQFQAQVSQQKQMQVFLDQYKKMNRGVSKQYLQQYWNCKITKIYQILNGSFIQDAKGTLDRYLKKVQMQKLLDLTVQKRIHDIANHLSTGNLLETLQQLNMRQKNLFIIDPALKCLAQLRQLRLNNNRISKIENLDAFTNLTLLHLGKNQITKIQNLQDLKQLQFLYLNQNHIKKFQNLRQLQNIKKIFFYKNPAVKIQAVQIKVEAQANIIEHFKSKRVKLIFKNTLAAWNQ